MFGNLFDIRRRARRQRYRSRRAVSLCLERLEDHIVPATINWDGGGGDFNWNNPVNWDTNTLPGGEDSVAIGALYSGTSITHSAGTTTVSDLITFANLVVSGGSFSLAHDSTILDDLTLSGGTLTPRNLYIGDTFDWTGGTYAGFYDTVLTEGAQMNISGLPAVSGVRTIRATALGAAVNWTSGTIFGSGTTPSLRVGGQLNISGSSDKHLNGLELAMSGRTIWNGSGDLVLDNGASFENRSDGVFEARNDASLETRIISAGTFTNFGTFRKLVGTGTTSIGYGGLEFRNAGTLDLQTGTLEVTGGGTLRLDEPVTGDGILRVNGGTLANAVSS